MAVTSNARPELIAGLDRAAAELLRRAMGDDMVASDGPPPVDEPVKPTLAEQVKVFEAVKDWVLDREKVVPPDKEPSAFDDIKRRFNGTSRPARGRGASATPLEEAEA